MQYKLRGISGKEMRPVFEAAIMTEGIGYDEMGRAYLADDGATWTTCFSSFKYEILNPDGDDPAEILYDGAVRGFLAQNLLPKELFHESYDAMILEGSGLQSTS